LAFIRAMSMVLPSAACSTRPSLRKVRDTAWIAIATTGTVVFIGVLPGILLGTAFSIALLLAELARPHDALLVRKPGPDELHDLGDDDREEDIPGLVVYRFYGPLIFANVNYFIERLQG
jgi:sulfate permease, SulP family